MTTDLSDLLRRAAEPIAERDFVDLALAGARARRLRHRHVGVAAAVAAVAVAASVVLAIPGMSREDTGVRGQQLTTWSSSTFDLLDIDAIAGPAPSQMVRVPTAPDDLRASLELPSTLDFDESTPMTPLSSLEGNPAPVRAVMLRATGDGNFQPVLYRPTLPTPFVLVDSLTLVPNADDQGNTSDPLAVRAISADRRRVVFVQPGKVLVLDADTGQVTAHVVPDPSLESVGWVDGSDWILATSAERQWRISSTTGQVGPITQAYAGPHHLVVTADGTNELRRHDAEGLRTGVRFASKLFSGTGGETITSSAGWAASAGWLSSEAETAARGLNQGVLAIRPDTMEDGVVLLAATEPGVSKGCCQPLAWGGPEQLLVRWGSDLLAWNVATGAVVRVSALPGTQPPGLGRPSWVIAIAP